MQSFVIDTLLAKRARGNTRYLEFLRAPTLSMGIYHLKAGQPDPQPPHDRDEVYYILSGRASIRVADEVQAVAAGSIVFVGKGVDHKFMDITEDLTTLVFFEESSRSGHRP
jgi:mannose-6-phosphate isomerase-like protein (cupin superfamily)